MTSANTATDPSTVGRSDSDAVTPAGQRPAPVRPLFRSRTDRYLGGVCGGLAGYLGIDATLFRLVTVLLVLVGNVITVALYLAFWAIMPEEPAR